MEQLNKEELQKMTKKQLNEYCRKNSIRGYSNKTKPEKIKFILSYIKLEKPNPKPNLNKGKPKKNLIIERILVVIANSSKEISEKEIRKKLNRKNSLEKEIKYLRSKKLIWSPASSKGVYYYYINDKAIPLIRTRLNKKNKEIIKNLDKLPTALKPKTLFHVTNKENTSSILKKGLVPGIKQTSAVVSIDKIFLTDKDGVSYILDQMDIDIDLPVVIEIDTNGLDFYYDHEFYEDYEDSKINILKAIKENTACLYVYTKKVPKNKIIRIRKVKIIPHKYLTIVKMI